MDTLFVPGTPIVSTWLNDVNDLRYGLSPTEGDALLPVKSTASGSVNTNQHAVNESLPLSAKWIFGVVGDGIADDTAQFLIACNAAASLKRPLDICDLKINLASLTSSISSDNLVFVGNGNHRFVEVPENFLLETGDAAQYSIVKNQMISTKGSIIFSTYNGPLFTGKKFSGSGFTIMGFPGSTNSSAFVQTTQTTYPGWSQPFSDLHDVSIIYMGNDGLRAMGGSELYNLINVSCMYCSGYGIYIGQTNGQNSPIEYLQQVGGDCVSNLLGNILFEGVSKDVWVDGVLLNSPGQIDRLGAAPTIESNIVYAVRMRPSRTGIVSAQNCGVVNCRGEDLQGIVKFDAPLAGSAYWLSTTVSTNYLLPLDNTRPYYHATFYQQVIDLVTTNNIAPTGTRFYFDPTTSPFSDGLDITERNTVQNVTIDGFAFKTDRLYPLQKFAQNSTTLGNGTANTFSYQIQLVDTPPAAKASTVQAYCVSASAPGGTTFGIYIVFVSKLPNGNYYGITMSSGTTTGFTSPPTVSTAGMLSLPLAVNNYGRVTRIDFAAINPFTY